MIAFVCGEVAAITLSSAVVEVGGVGLELMCTPGTLATLRTGQRATLPTSDEKSTFELVQTASGVGPKLAQAMIAVLPPDDLRRAVASEDVATLTKVPGIGQKGAQRIILELRDRLGAPASVVRAGGQLAPPTWRDQVQQGLVGLGWSVKEADKAVDAVSDDAGDQPDVGALLRAALRTLSKA
jgi:Holliday junction DNA helicase RuvA